MTYRKASPCKSKAQFMPTERDREQVVVMAGMGMTHREIASVIINPATGRGINRETLADHFHEELRVGTAVIKGKVVGELLKRALDGDHKDSTTALIFICKSRFGWVDRHHHHVDANVSGVLVAPSERTPEQWIREQAAREN